MKVIKTGIICFVLLSCSNDNNKIEQISRKKADSLFQSELASMDAELDSLCKLKYSSGFQAKLDSLVEARRIEIINLQEGL